MGIMERISDGRRETLCAWHVVGRSRRSDLQLETREVSGQHAVVAWSGSGWFVRDLHSRNGTWVDGRPLSPGEDVVLSVGSEVAFGAPTEERWRLVSGEAPVAMAVSAEGAVVMARGGMLGLPDSEEPIVTIFQRPDGSWVAERDEGPQQHVRDQQLLEVSGMAWQLNLPEPLDSTWHRPDEPAVDTVRLRFRVSRDQEHVELTVFHRDSTIELRPRVHLEVLQVLARARLEDQQRAELPEAEHGWIYREDLARRLRVYDNRLYVYVFRAREQLAQAGIDNAASIIERRPDPGQVRLGVGVLEIIELA